MSERYARACAHKRGYNSERRASEAAKGSQIVFGIPMNSYKCDVCRKWHVGSTYPQNSTAARREAEVPTENAILTTKEM